ncbi:hypothetical protein HOJ01_00450 [bacterium]|nr:hypothetical protein [bacterium]
MDNKYKTPEIDDGKEKLIGSNLDFNQSEIQDEIQCDISVETELLLNQCGEIADRDFSGKNLSHLNFAQEITFINCNFSNCNLAELDFSSVTFKNCNFEFACFNDVTFGKFISCDLRGISAYQFFVTESTVLIKCDFTDSTLGLCTSDYEFCILDVKFENITPYFSDSEIQIIPFLRMNVSFVKNVNDKFDADFSNSSLMRANLQGANLEGVNLMGANLEGVNLMGANLSGANLINANLEGADLRGASLERINLKTANLKGANLEGADLCWYNCEGDICGIDLRGANLEGANLNEANLHGTDLSGANLEGADLEGICLNEANLEGVDLRNLNFKEKTSLVNCNFSKCNLAGLDLSNVTFKNCKFELACFDDVIFGKFISCDLRGISAYQFFLTESTVLIKCDFTDSTLGLCTSDVEFCILDVRFENITPYFSDSEIQINPFLRMNVSFVKNINDKYDASFSMLNLIKADLKGLYLKRADLSGLDLSFADLSYSDLSYADLTGANLEGANLEDVVLRGADLTGVNLEGANLEGAVLRGANFRGAELRYTILSWAWKFLPDWDFIWK